MAAFISGWLKDEIKDFEKKYEKITMQASY
jgi:hypothetical protein